MKKNRLIQWLALMLIGALLLCFAACKDKPVEPPTTDPFLTEPPTTTEPPTVAGSAIPGFWSIELRGVPTATTFTSEEAQWLPKVQIEMTTTNPETGLTAKNTYGGVTLRSLLSNYSIQAVSSVTVSSLSGAAVEYDAMMAMAENTVLAWEIDGAPIDAEPPLRMCPGSGTAEFFIKQVSSLSVVPTTAVPTTQTTFPTPPIGNVDPAPTQWSTYPSSVPGVEPPTEETRESTTESTTSTTTVTRTTEGTRSTYVYVPPSTDPTQPPTKPDWWPPGIDYP